MKRRELAQFIYAVLFPCCIALGSLAIEHLYYATLGRRPRCRKIPNWKQYIASLTVTSVFALLMSIWTVIVCYSLRTPKWSYDKEKNSILHRSRSFYHLVINICGLVPIIVAVALGPNVGLTLSPGVCSKRVPICSNDTNIFSLIAIHSNKSVGNVCLRFRIITILGYIVIALYGIVCLSLLNQVILPAKIRGTIRIVRRSVERSIQSLHRTHETTAHRLLCTADQDESEDDSPDLVSVLRKKEIASLIAQNLHFIEVLNLGMASKSLQAALFRPRDRRNQREVMRATSCVQGLKSQCWTCGTQICKECKVCSRLQSAPATTHLVNCTSYCTKCFYFEVCIQPYRNYKGHTPCDCRCRQSSAGHNLAALEQRDICRNCAALPVGDALGIRNRREIDGLQVLQSRTLQCLECTRSLSRNERRWWACSLCKQECMWEGHRSKELKIRLNRMKVVV